MASGLFSVNLIRGWGGGDGGIHLRMSAHVASFSSTAGLFGAWLASYSSSRADGLDGGELWLAGVELEI